MGHMPRMSFGRGRYDLEGLGVKEGELVPGARALSPQAQEVAARTYVAGGRARGRARVLQWVAADQGAVGKSRSRLWCCRERAQVSPKHFN